MLETNTLFLHDAVLALYPAASDGQSIVGGQMFWGAVANRLKLAKTLEGVKLAASGDAYRTNHQVDEDHSIEVDKTWIFLRSAMQEFTMPRGQQYVLQIVWADKSIWWQRTYYGVTCERGEWASAGTNQFGMDLALRAQFFNTAGGPRAGVSNIGGTGGTVYTPIVPAGGELQEIPFFREEIFSAGDYLLGHFLWPVAVTAVSATAIAWSPQTTPAVLGLEVAGVQTGLTLTLPVGSPNVETAPVTVNLGNLTIAPGSTVRWRCLTGPANVGDEPWHAALVMGIKVPTS